MRVSDSATGFYTRDILQVEGTTPEGDTVVLLVNHWPSKRGGEEADAQRLRIADTLRRQMLELHAKHPQAAVIAMGDMNTTADEPAVADGMGFGDDSVNADGIRNLIHRLPNDWGSHKYQGEWRYIDQVFLLADAPWEVKKLKLLKFDHLLTDERATAPASAPSAPTRAPATKAASATTCRCCSKFPEIKTNHL